ncbi:MAG: hypothetical protein ACRD8Z_14250 [Nitrososphaeraceae archaeon]
MRSIRAGKSFFHQQLHILTASGANYSPGCQFEIEVLMVKIYPRGDGRCVGGSWQCIKILVFPLEGQISLWNTSISIGGLWLLFK